LKIRCGGVILKEELEMLNEAEKITPRIETSKKLLIPKEIYSEALEKGIKYKQ
jgi:hypothetical protein